MRNSKGFTLIEMMVGSIVLLAVILITTSFFRAQSEAGGQLVKDTGSREAMSQLSAILRRDIMHAGNGLQNQPELGLWADAYSTDTNSFHRLYVNCAYYTSTYPTKDWNVYSYTNNKAAIFQGVSSFTLPLMRPEDIYGVVTYAATTKLREFIKTDASYDISTDQTTYTLKSTAGGLPFTPVIYYSLMDPATSTDSPPYLSTNMDNLELRRNGLGLIGGAKDPLIKITDFSIRCQFINALGTPVWLPTITESTFQSEPYSTLRTIEIQIKFKTLRAGSDSRKTQNWRQQIKLLSISPRNLVFAAYDQ